MKESNYVSIDTQKGSVSATSFAIDENQMCLDLRFKDLTASVQPDGLVTMQLPATEAPGFMSLVGACFSDGRKYYGLPTTFSVEWRQLASLQHDIAAKNGFWQNKDEKSFFASRIALIHSELSEALEVARKNESHQPDDKVSEFTKLEVELADAVLRIMDLSHGLGLRVAQALEAKLSYNATREFMHGKTM